MRLAYEGGEDWLAETLEPHRESLEPHRESTAAQAAFALVLEKEAGVRSVLS